MIIRPMFASRTKTRDKLATAYGKKTLKSVEA